MTDSQNNAQVQSTNKSFDAQAAEQLSQVPTQPDPQVNQVQPSPSPPQPNSTQIIKGTESPNTAKQE